jgi:hypothetical protein
MAGLTLRVARQDIKNFDTEALVVGFHENVRPLKRLAGALDWLLCGSLSRLIISRKLRGRVGDAALLTSRGKIPARKIFLVGLGPVEDRSSASLSNIAASVIETVLKAGVRQATLEYFVASDIPVETGVPALCSGITRAIGERDLDIVILLPPGAALEKISYLVSTCAAGTAATPAAS